MVVTGDTIANEVILTRQSYSGTIFIVEGDGDEKLFRRFTNDPEAAIIPAWGKENALEAAEILNRENRRGFLTIVDADFDHINCKLPSSPNVISTDDHDLEMMIIRSKSFISVLRELGSQEKIDRFTGCRCLAKLRDTLLGRTLSVGLLRMYSLSDNLRLCFDGLNFGRFVDKNSLIIDVKQLVENVLAITANRNLKTSDIVSKLEEMIANNKHDMYQVCCGHDFIVILGIGLRRALGSKSKEATEPENLEKVFRLSYDTSSFTATQLYHKAKQWEKKTSRSRLLNNR